MVVWKNLEPYLATRAPHEILGDLSIRDMEKYNRQLLGQDQGPKWERLTEQIEKLEEELAISRIYAELRANDPDTSSKELLEIATMQHKLGVKP